MAARLRGAAAHVPDGGDPALNVAITVAICTVPPCVVDPA